jgi:hypothetical protein
VVKALGSQPQGLEFEPGKSQLRCGVVILSGASKTTHTAQVASTPLPPPRRCVAISCATALPAWSKHMPSPFLPPLHWRCGVHASGWCMSLLGLQAFASAVLGWWQCVAVFTNAFVFCYSAQASLKGSGDQCYHAWCNKGNVLPVRFCTSLLMGVVEYLWSILPSCVSMDVLVCWMLVLVPNPAPYRLCSLQTSWNLWHFNSWHLPPFSLRLGLLCCICLPRFGGEREGGGGVVVERKSLKHSRVPVWKGNESVTVANWNAPSGV